MISRVVICVVLITSCLTDHATAAQSLQAPTHRVLRDYADVAVGTVAVFDAEPVRAAVGRCWARPGRPDQAAYRCRGRWYYDDIDADPGQGYVECIVHVNLRFHLGRPVGYTVLPRQQCYSIGRQTALGNDARRSS